MVPNKIFLSAVFISFLVSTCAGDKILFLLPLASRSHVHVFEPLMRALGERGHDIIALSPVKSPNMPSNVKTISLITLDDVLGRMPSAFVQRQQGKLKQLFNSSTFDVFNDACKKALTHPEMKNLLENEKFDLVITDIALNFCVMGILPILNTSQVHVCTMAPPGLLASIVGNRFPYSFVPSMFLQYSDKMSFSERIMNTVVELLGAIGWRLVMMGKQENLYRQYLPNGENLPGLDEIFDNTSLIFGNSHFSLSYPRPYLPDIQEVGGMHTRPAKKLPKDLDEFLSGSGKDGFILFSLGSIVKPHDMPETTRKVFINVFSRLKQRVIWKWDTEIMPDLPKNVKLSKWLPQQDILGHPNQTVHVTRRASEHTGKCLSWSAYSWFTDFWRSGSEARGYAKFVEIIDLTEKQLEDTINELLNNPSYSEKVKSLSKIFRDQPETPLERAIFHTEYVLRHKGAPHLRSGARDLNFFQYWLLDVIATLLLVSMLSMYLIFVIFKAILKRICSFGKSKSKVAMHFKKE